MLVHSIWFEMYNDNSVLLHMREYNMREVPADIRINLPMSIVYVRYYSDYVCAKARYDELYKKYSLRIDSSFYL